MRSMHTMLKVITRALLAIPLLPGLYGCNTQAPINAREEAYQPRQIQLADEDLRRNTRFGEPRVTRDPAGLLFVTIPVRATIDETLHTQYRATFFDETGQTLPGSPTTWFDKTLNPRVFDSITIKSTSPRAEPSPIAFRSARCPRRPATRRPSGDLKPDANSPIMARL